MHSSGAGDFLRIFRHILASEEASYRFERFELVKDQAII
jgi:hypothetical protein